MRCPSRVGAAVSVLWFALGGLLVAACGDGTCRDPDSGVVDARQDSGHDAAADAALDASVVIDAGCPPVRPGRLHVAPYAVAVDEADTPDCRRPGGAGDLLGEVRFVLTRHGETTPLIDEVLPTCTAFAGDLVAGDYDLALVAGQWVVGGAIVRPERCPASLRPTPAFCAPVRLVMAPCGSYDVVAVLHCDPEEGPGSCPEASWPWEAAP